MPSLTRRNVLHAGIAVAVPSGILSLLAGCNPAENDSDPPAETVTDESARTIQDPTSSETAEQMKVHYLEIVTPEAEALCKQYADVHGVTFSEPEEGLGGARTAELDGGALLGIRAPMHDMEKPAVRPYVLVTDIKASVDSAAEAGATVAVPPMPIPNRGTCAVLIHGGIECGLWQI